MATSQTVQQHMAYPNQGSSSRELHLYNTLARTKEPFTTIEDGKVRMYVCGVTVYDAAHIGHGMSAITFDVIRRYLEHLGYEVEHAQNFTDIDDKIIKRANQEGIDPHDLAERLIAEWLEEINALNTLPATVYPRATQEVPEIIAMIEGLIERGHAYAVHGDVYFKVRSFPDYGKLSHRDPDELRSGARIDVDERKQDPLDFALWKATKPGEPSWPSPWGEGRPGWHIECSAMCTHHLGGLVDIHGGGADLIFPHHENEVAQSESYLGEEPFARYWVHNGMMQLRGEKMSKSLGNVVTLDSILRRGRADAFRLMVLQSHYRAPLTYSEEVLEAAQSGLQRLRTAAKSQRGTSTETDSDAGLTNLTRSIIERFHAAMLDDFDTPRAVAALFDLGRAINRASKEHGSSSIDDARSTLVELAGILGLDLLNVEIPMGNVDDVDRLMNVLIEIRAQLREDKQFDSADFLRDRLHEEGFILEDTREGTTWKRAETT